MNPIEFLKQNGHNPDNFRTHLPQGPALPNCKTQYYHQNRTFRERPSAPPPAIPQQRDPAHLSLLDRFLAAKGWSSNGKTQYAPLVPYLLADLVMLTHDEYLKDTLSGKEKQHCRQMMRSYDHFIKDFFRCFTGHHTDQAVELMDKFGDYLHTDLEIFRLSLQQPLMEYPSSFRRTLSAICVCRLLTSQADLVYSSVYYTPLGKKLINPYLQSMEYHSRQMFIWFTKRDAGAHITNIDLSDFPNIRESMNRVNDRILQFIKENDNNN